MTPVVMENTWVRLEPLHASHQGFLRIAADDESVWTYSPQGVGLRPLENFERWWAKSLTWETTRADFPFAVFRRDSGQWVGSTRYLNFAPHDLRVEIGNTWYQANARGSVVNPACKLLMLGHAFEVLKLQRVELKCDARNVQSRNAIVKMGAREEGTLRKHMVLGDGYTRDTVYFSVLAEEWPGVRQRLEARCRDS
ncbi:MAG: GNAT family N-acetyltransferase [Myxococcaceae bacterium]|nr:GNAT family N-acetyltransferase [Myxococcaceae bacterium]